MASVYSVTQVNAYIKSLFDKDFALKRIYVKGEASNVKYHQSGHIYFTIKDAKAALNCVMFAGNRSGLKFRMADGDRVIVLGGITVYEAGGRYQMYAREIVLDGEGQLYAAIEALKQKLAAEGLFDEEHKKPLPLYPMTIGVVTAPRGAALQDIINITKRRNPYVRLIIYPAKVQGDGAAETICEGIRRLEKENVEVIIVGRGGGSIEDLMPFNDEAVARAIHECGIPVISAVGHETDNAISDLAADLRAPTPSAAAELAVWDIREFAELLAGYMASLKDGLAQKIKALRNRLSMTELRLKHLHPEAILLEKKQKAADLWIRLDELMARIMADKAHRYDLYREKLKGLSPLERLSAGYALVRKDEGIIRSIAEVETGDKITVSLKDGDIEAVVNGKTCKERELWRVPQKIKKKQSRSRTHLKSWMLRSTLCLMKI